MNDILKRKIDEVILILEEKMPADVQREIVEASQDDLCLWHFTLGVWIRNHLLPVGGDLFNLFLHCGYDHKDDMSDVIMTALHDELSRCIKLR